MHRLGGGRRGQHGGQAGDVPAAIRVVEDVEQAAVEDGAEGEQPLPRARSGRVARHPGREHAVAELGAEDRSVKKIAVAFKESRRVWFRDLLIQLGVADAEGLATQLTLLVDGSIAQDLVRDDPAMARAAKQAARVLLANVGIDVDGGESAKKPQRAAKKRGSTAGITREGG